MKSKPKKPVKPTKPIKPTKKKTTTYGKLRIKWYK